MTSAIIVAAGKGTRMGTSVDKLFLEVNGRPVVAHTWKRFDDSPSIDQIVIVVRDGMESAFKDLARQYGFAKNHVVVIGGKERQDSVWNGLEALPNGAEVVAIQDGARPCTTERLLASTIDAARQFGAAVAAQPVTDTIKESVDGELISKNLERAKLFAVQTPQTFRVEVIRLALAEVRKRSLVVTDDTAACELINQRVKLVLSSEPNPKVTRPEDLSVIEQLLKCGK
jgi:2-C-methyl-D-erythritol 4-phosphate cytidylyltransferase